MSKNKLPRSKLRGILAGSKSLFLTPSSAQQAGRFSALRNQIALSSLALDLKRVALLYHRGSIATAKRFFEEAIIRKDEIDIATVKPYVKKLLDKLDSLAAEKDTDRIAEDALMYSTLFQNAAMARQK